MKKLYYILFWEEDGTPDIKHEIADADELDFSDTEICLGETVEMAVREIAAMCDGSYSFDAGPIVQALARVIESEAKN